MKERYGTMADMYYKGHWYGADNREEFLNLIRVGESNVSGNIWEGGFLPPYTVAEAKEAYAMGLYHDRENGRTARKEISLYDAMMAEMIDERNAEKAKVRNRRKADRKHPENKAERKKEKQNRMHRLYGLAYEDTKYGKTVYFWGKKEGQKKFPEYEAEIFRNMKERSAEQIAWKDYEIELRNIAEDAERNAIEAEIRGWELMHAVEQANARAWMAMQDWLEWA